VEHSGRRDRFERLLRPHFDALYRTARRTVGNAALAEEVVQDACLKAYLGFERGAVIISFKAWIFRILINCCVDTLREHRRVELVPVDALPPTPVNADDTAAATDPERAFANTGLRTSIDTAIAALAPELRVVVLLVLVEGLSYGEAAESLQITVKKVKSRLHRARTYLRAALARSIDDSPAAGPHSMRDGEPVSAA